MTHPALYSNPSAAVIRALLQHKHVVSLYAKDMAYPLKAVVHELDLDTEPPRLYRRLHILRGWSHELTKTIFPRSPGASCSISP